MNEIEIDAEIYRLRGLLNAVSDASYQYKTLYSKYPVSNIKGDDKVRLVSAYKSIIEQLLIVLSNYKT